MRSRIYDQVAAALTVRDIACTLPRIEARLAVAEAASEVTLLGTDIIGIVVEDACEIGYVDLSVEWESPDANVRSWMQPIPPNQIVSESLPIADLVPLFGECFFYFVLRRNRVTGLVSYLDLDKLPFRLALFSILMGLESEMVAGIRDAERGVEHYLSLLSPARLEKAHELLKLRHEFGERDDRRRQTEQLLKCTSFADRAAIWLKDQALASRLGFATKRDGRRFMKLAESVRNQVAHGNSIVELFPAPADLIDFIETLKGETIAASFSG